MQCRELLRYYQTEYNRTRGRELIEQIVTVARYCRQPVAVGGVYRYADWLQWQRRELEKLPAVGEQLALLR
jgi:hypothetical protein